MARRPSLVPALARLAIRSIGAERSAPALAYALLLLFALLACGVAGVAFELLLVFDTLLFGAARRFGGFARERLELQLFLPRGFLGGAARRLGGLGLGLAFCRSISRSARASRISRRLASRSRTAGSLGSYFGRERNFSAISLRALAAAAWRSRKLFEFRNDIAFQCCC